MYLKTLTPDHIILWTTATNITDTDGGDILKITRIHSSTMCTIRTLTISSILLCSGAEYLVTGVYLVTAGVYLVLGGVPGHRGEYLVTGGTWSQGGVPGPGGSTWSQGVYLARGGTWSHGGVPGQVLTPVNRITDRCKNITFATSLRTVKSSCVVSGLFSILCTKDKCKCRRQKAKHYLVKAGLSLC